MKSGSKWAFPNALGGQQQAAQLPRPGHWETDELAAIGNAERREVMGKTRQFPRFPRLVQQTPSPLAATLVGVKLSTSTSSRTSFTREFTKIEDIYCRGRLGSSSTSTRGIRPSSRYSATSRLSRSRPGSQRSSRPSSRYSTTSRNTKTTRVGPSAVEANGRVRAAGPQLQQKGSGAPCGIAKRSPCVFTTRSEQEHMPRDW